MSQRSLEELRQAAQDICKEIALRGSTLGSPRNEREVLDRLGPLLTLSRQVQAFPAEQRPEGTLHALGINWDGRKPKATPWSDLAHALDHVGEKTGLEILALIKGSPSARKSPQLLQRIRVHVLNRPAWRVQAIEAHPILFASKTESIEAGRLEKARAIQAPLHTSEPSAPNRRCSGQDIRLPYLEPQAFSRNAFVIWMSTISMEERNDAKGLQGSHETVQALKAAGVVFPVDAKEHNTPIHAGANISMPSRMRALCEAYPDMVDRLNADGNTALHKAAAGTSLPALRALIDGGSNTIRLNSSGQSPLDISVSKRNAPVVATLLSDEHVLQDAYGLKRARRWIMGNLSPDQFKPKGGDQEVLALLQAAEARLEISRVLTGNNRPKHAS